MAKDFVGKVTEAMEQYAAAAVAKERKRCAAIALDPKQWKPQRDRDHFPANGFHKEAAAAIAAAIRGNIP